MSKNHEESYLIAQQSVAMESLKNLNYERIRDLARDILECWTIKGKVAFVGNGGSAAEAMHLAAEFTGKCIRDHKPLPVLCLNESQSSITAIGNDYGFEYVFSRQVEALLVKPDILICLSTSGKSKNIVNALQYANKLGIKSFLWTGPNLQSYNGTSIWNSVSKSTPRIQEEHLLWGHLLSEIIEMKLDAN